MLRRNIYTGGIFVQAEYLYRRKMCKGGRCVKEKMCKEEYVYRRKICKGGRCVKREDIKSGWDGGCYGIGNGRI